MIRAIFICSGNICRSPMAEVIFRARASAQGIPHMALSMGTLNLHGRRADRFAVRALAELDLDGSEHRSQGISIGLLQHATHVLAMETHHVDAVVRIAPQLSQRISLLGAYDEAPVDQIDDPVGGTLDQFRACRDRIIVCVDGFIARTAPK